MKIELHSLFAAPLIKFRFSQHEKYNFKEIGRIDNTPPGWQCCLNSSFPMIMDNDEFISMETRNDLIEDLINDIKNVMISMVDIDTNNFALESLWYNIYHEDQNQEIHDHLGLGSPILSGIYYNKNASPTVFHRIDRYHNICKFDGVDDSILEKFYSGTEEIDVEDGDVVLFQPWMPHSVNPSNSDRMRLTFSFNIEYNQDISEF